MIWDWPDSVVTRVVDGDTFVARVTKVVDIGFHGIATVAFEQKLRLNRTNASPANTPLGAAATGAFKDLVMGGVPVHITTVGPYKYGDEWMAEAVLPDGRNVSDILIASGAVQYWDGKGPRPGG